MTPDTSNEPRVGPDEVGAHPFLPSKEKASDLIPSVAQVAIAFIACAYGLGWFLHQTAIAKLTSLNVHVARESAIFTGIVFLVVASPFVSLTYSYLFDPQRRTRVRDHYATFTASGLLLLFIINSPSDSDTDFVRFLLSQVLVLMVFVTGLLSSLMPLYGMVLLPGFASQANQMAKDKAIQGPWWKHLGVRLSTSLELASEKAYSQSPLVKSLLLMTTLFMMAIYTSRFVNFAPAPNPFGLTHSPSYIRLKEPDEVLVGFVLSNSDSSTIVYGRFLNAQTKYEEVKAKLKSIKSTKELHVSQGLGDLPMNVSFPANRLVQTITPK